MVAAAVLGTRLPVLLLGALAVTIVGTVPPPAAEALWRVSPHELTNLLARWDTFFYYSIATGGYHWDPAIFRHENVVFFPLYPLLMRWGGARLGGHPLLAGLLVSLVAFAVAMVLLYRLAVLEVGEEYAGRVMLLLSDVSVRAVLFGGLHRIAVPVLTVGAFYAMRRGRLGWAAVCGTGRRTDPSERTLAGVAAGAAAAADAGGVMRLARARAASVVASDRAARRLRADRRHRSSPLSAVPLRRRAGLGPRSGGVGRAAVLRAVAPDPVRLPGEPVVKLTEVIGVCGDIAAFIAAAAAIRPVTRRFGVAYGAWIAVNLVPPVVAHLFISVGRFTSVLFPVFFWLAIRIPRERCGAVGTPSLPDRRCSPSGSFSGSRWCESERRLRGARAEAADASRARRRAER